MADTDQEQLHAATLLANLQLSPQERVEAHASALQLASMLEIAGSHLRAQSL